MKTGISPGLVENPPPFPNSGKVEGQKPGLDHLTAEELGSGQGQEPGEPTEPGQRVGAPQPRAPFQALYKV